MEQVGARHVEAPARARVPAAPVAGRRRITRDRRGPARPAAVRVRGGALCPSPVVPPRATPAARRSRTFLLRRVTAGIGLAVASAAAVVGLGLLADVAGASAASAPAVTPVPVVAQQ